MPGPRPTAFKDHFSAVSGAYARHRPGYPDTLFDWLADACTRHDSAWDAATGSGQAAVGLAGRFALVVASDASARQLGEARAHPSVRYLVARAEAGGLARASVDLVTVAQAAHWLDLDAFYAEARRVLRPGGMLALWCYGRPRLEGQADEVLARFHGGTVGGDWPPERALVDGGYAALPFPFPERVAPELAIEARWTLADLLGYVETWSAVAAHRERRGSDPVPALAAELGGAWGSDGQRLVRWPLHVRAAVIGAR